MLSQQTMIAESQSLSRPSRLELLWSFSLVGLMGFGGVLPWARHMMVDRRRWVDDHEFTELLTLGQFFPGPNVANVCIIFGRREQGWSGACCAVLGLYFFPTIITIAAGFAIEWWWNVPEVQQVFGAVMPVASGLMLGTVLRLMKGVPKTVDAYFILALTFVLMAIAKLPLWLVLAICLPLTLTLGFGRLRNARVADK